MIRIREQVMFEFTVEYNGSAFVTPGYVYLLDVLNVDRSRTEHISMTSRMKKK